MPALPGGNKSDVLSKQLGRAAYVGTGKPAGCEVTRSGPHSGTPSLERHGKTAPGHPHQDSDSCRHGCKNKVYGQLWTETQTGHQTAVLLSHAWGIFQCWLKV